jgi:hypothetical protein
MSVRPESQALRRNEIVRIFGTPDKTVGSVNEPRLQLEHGVEFNEKWIYEKPRHEPSRPRRRVIYWQRYDLVASMRIEQDGHAVPESPGELRARA